MSPPGRELSNPADAAGRTAGAAARRVALGVLARIEDDRAYANLVLGPELDRSGLELRDRALVTDLVYGTVRRRRSLDHLVDRFLTSPPPPAARRALRIGAYQLALRDDIPDHAAVSATVEATPKRFRGLVNAVLRKVATAPVSYPDTATELSYPDWILELLTRDHGAVRARAVLAAMNEPAPVMTRADGYVQDRASQWVVDAVDAGPGELVADLCAAPGGKATGLAAAGATVVASDLRAGRVSLIADNATRLGASGVLALVADATAPPLRPASCDRVLLDAPCSGLGVLRRRADARWRLDPGAVGRLAALQRDLVVAASDLVRPGGVLVLSVCTLDRDETIGVDDHLAAIRPGLEPIPPPGEPWEPWGRGAILMPDRCDADGMALFRYRRSGP